MIEFVTLFLGLVTGPIQIGLAVDGDIAEVVLELDGEEVSRLEEAPWRAEIDLGDALEPHRLEARGFDKSGSELDRAVQYLNLPRPPAEVNFLLRRDGSQRVTSVGLAWQSRAGADLLRISVSLDGEPIQVDDPEWIALPALDPQELHLLEAEVVFSDGAIARDQLGIGGHFLAETSARLTAVAGSVADADKVPTADSATARHRQTDEPLRVVAIESGGAEIVFVRDRLAAAEVKRLMPIDRPVGRLAGSREALIKRLNGAVPLQAGEAIRVLSALGFTRSGTAVDHDLFPLTPAIDHETGGGVYWHLTSEIEIEVEGERTTPRLTPRLSDAVAIAASQAATGNHRRAVVLLLAPGSEDKGSRLRTEPVRDYLRALGVELHVWYLGKAVRAPQEWGEPRIVRTIDHLQEAMDELRSTLARQRIVWVEGLHLPNDVDVSLGGV